MSKFATLNLKQSVATTESVASKIETIGKVWQKKKGIVYDMWDRVLEKCVTP
jgi:hypothetical protein